MQGLDSHNILAPKATSGTKKDPNLVPSITNKQKLGYTCQEDNSAAMNWKGAAIWLWLHKGKA